MLFPRVCFSLVIGLTLSSPARAGAKASLPSFLFGTCDSNPAALPYLTELGLHWARVDIPWKAVTPEGQTPELTLAEVLEHPERVDALIRETDWSWVDGRRRELLDRGVQPIPVIGHGYRSQHALIQGELAR